MGCFSMPKGVPKKRYTGEFKQLVVETMRNEKLGCREAGRRFDVAPQRICDWERIYLTEGPEALYIERRGRGSKGNPKGRPPKFDKKLEEDLLAENQRLRAEIAYLKKLQALVLEEEQHKSKKQK
jgi:transposase-like protein